MKTKIILRTSILTILVFTISNILQAQPKAPAGKRWKEVTTLTDEFDTWDKSKWTKSLWNYGVPVQMKANNSGVSEGKLWIKATLNEGAERWFESSRVMSKTKIKFPMYTECSMKTAHISAYNTFWMNNGDIDDRDEIDMCENNSKPSDKSQTDERQHTMYSQYFVVKDGDTERNKGNFDNRKLSKSNPMRGVKWNEAYHTIGVWWKDANHIQFYLDGEPAGKVQSVRDFTLDLNIIWDLWTIDESWAGGIAIKEDLLDDKINTMYVDWVHTFTLEDDPDADDVSETNPETDPDDDKDPETVTGIEDLQRSSNIQIFPNPVKGKLNIKLSEKVDPNAKVQVFNTAGVLIKEEVLKRKNTKLSIVDLEPSVYLIKVRNGEITFKESIIIK